MKIYAEKNFSRASCNGTGLRVCVVINGAVYLPPNKSAAIATTSEIICEFIATGFSSFEVRTNAQDSESLAVRDAFFNVIGMTTCPLKILMSVGWLHEKICSDGTIRTKRN
jgi:hypothetical protein